MPDCAVVERMLLMFPQPRTRLRRRRLSLPSDEEQPICLDDELYAANSGKDGIVLQVEDLAHRVLREEPLDRPILTVGRGPDNDLWLDHDRILPRHLILLWLEGGVFFITPSSERKFSRANGRSVRDGGRRECVYVSRIPVADAKPRKSPPEFDPLAASAARWKPNCLDWNCVSSAGSAIAVFGPCDGR